MTIISPRALFQLNNQGGSGEASVTQLEVFSGTIH
ncbi:hypothetical protein Pan54_20480 [Rubinisphaera italica]|uniref:Uncharacterized protein n=1 Tax=Rubinisphaera italica TaxID=2527969 RepID=A0A5C5XHG4_9PLAN|nr:hypothetical protein Pan54_20480 [Rubinisphaera italica]